ncbi:MAG TPA: hypothetical protein VLE91_04590 [Candidatus Saccharimonadales bacterium]|nr:hypothetical protein [Candidatus Saccharimonadales bacterium]
MNEIRLAQIRENARSFQLENAFEQARKKGSVAIIYRQYGPVAILYVLTSGEKVFLT